MDSRIKLLKMFESWRVRELERARMSGIFLYEGSEMEFLYFSRERIKKHSVRILYIGSSYGMGIKRSYIFSSGRMMFRLCHLLIRYLLQAVCL